MAIEATRNNICVNHIIGQKTENFVVEGDSIIPDIKPDIIGQISTSGTVCIYKKELSEGKIRLDGGIDTYVMYLADDEKSSVRSVNVNLDFTQIIEMEKVSSGMNLETNVKLKNIECKIINGRKINLKAFVEVDVKVTSTEELDIINEVNSSGIQMLNENMSINSFIGGGSVKAYAKDTVVIDSIDNLAEIMKSDLSIMNKDVKISYNKVLAKADLNLRIMYLTDDNRINTIESTIPIMGFIDIENVSEDNLCDTRYEIKNVVLKPNNVEEHSIYVEVEVEISCGVYRTQEINIIQDLYSPTANIMFTKKQVQILQKIESMQSTCNVREKQVIPEIGANKIYDVALNVDITKQTLLNDRILFEGELNLDYIFDAGNNSVDTKKTKIPFSFNLDFNGINQNSNVETSTEISMQNFVITEDGSIDVKVDVVFNVMSIKNAMINIIDDINEAENRDFESYSLIIYYVKSGDTLWNIAKRFRSTVDEIARINGIEDVDRLNVGEQLFIPRYNG